MTARQLKASARVHTPVMVDAMLAALAPQDGEAFVDGTFGGGGYAKALLEAAQCQVWGIDRDPDGGSARFRTRKHLSRPPPCIGGDVF